MSAPNIEGTTNPDVVTGGVFGSQVGKVGEVVTVPSDVTFTGNVTFPNGTVTIPTGVTITSPTLTGNTTITGNVVYPSHQTIPSPVFTGVVDLPSYTLNILPVVVPGGLIFVSNAASGNGAVAFGANTGAAWLSTSTGNVVV